MKLRDAAAALCCMAVAHYSVLPVKFLGAAPAPNQPQDSRLSMLHAPMFLLEVGVGAAVTAAECVCTYCRRGRPTPAAS